MSYVEISEKWDVMAKFIAEKYTPEACIDQI